MVTWLRTPLRETSLRLGKVQLRVRLLDPQFKRERITTNTANAVKTTGLWVDGVPIRKHLRLCPTSAGYHRFGN